MKLNHYAFNHARKLIDKGKVVHNDLEKLPNPTEENIFLRARGIPELSGWYLGIEDDLDDREWDVMDSASIEVTDKYRYPLGDLHNLYIANLKEIIRDAESEGAQDIKEAARKLLEMLEKNK